MPKVKKVKKERMQKALAMVQRLYPGVTKVVDGDDDIHIDVTGKDNSSAAVRNHKDCALAVACKRGMSLDGAIVARSVAYLVKGTKATRYIMPPSVSKEIVAFDRGGKFAAGSYALKAPTSTARLGRNRGNAPLLSGVNNGNLSKRFRHVTTDIRSNLMSRDVV